MPPGKEGSVRIAVLNFAIPERDPAGDGIRWWHKSGSRWPASVLNRRTDGSEYFPWPFLLSYLTNMLRADGHEVALLDGCLAQWSLYDAVGAVRQVRPDYIVFETSEQTEHTDVEVIGGLSTIAPIVLIGPNVAPDRGDLLQLPGCGAAIPGEYLASTVQFFRHPHDGFADPIEISGQEQMDALPFAYREPGVFPRYNARFKSTPPGVQGQFVTMWGCQYRCKFCIWIHAYWPRSSQFQKQFSLPRLKAELDHMQAAFPAITSLYDDSDNHHYKGETALEFAELMGRRLLPWAVLTRADTYMTPSGDIDREVWKAYRDNGCYGVKIGVEGAQEVMNATNKHLSESVVREFVPLMQDLGISIYCSFMIGVPNTSPESDLATLNLIDDLAAYRPDLFEYLISRCDVTRATPFIKDVALSPRLHDGQLAIEELKRMGTLRQEFNILGPNNL